ncbi:MAG: NAD-dependent epimerase/dehydratase family protein [Verrucomicrobia bacterium]|nr:NAD-dependent epimerase/dehydratase family protein [Verrucomicrobiota bacterium]
MFFGVIPKIAILGANGFVASRLIEVFHLGGVAKLRPIVRNFSSLARLARFELDWRLADARDAAALKTAFEGCDAVVNLIVADPEVIVQNATASYEAAQAAGVKRLVFLSTASVHGQAPAPGTDETSALHTEHVFAYNNAKVRAERALAGLRARGSVELVMLRPGVVFGPRSRWVSDAADQLRAGTAWFINDGQGVCNSIYVDNLIEAIRLALTSDKADEEAFLVGDRERVTWLDFYRPIADALGVDLAAVPRIATPHFDHSWKKKLGGVRASKSVQAVMPMFPTKLKDAVKGAIKAATAPPWPSQWELPGQPGPVVTEEMCALQSCTVHLPWKKAAERLGYEPRVSFEEGMKRSIGWLKFAGYPVTA